MLAHRKSRAADLRQHLENVQVGGVVAAEQHPPSRKRLLVQQGAQADPFVDAAGPRINHRLAFDQGDAFRRQQVLMLRQRRLQDRLGFWRKAIVQRQAVNLVFQQNTGMGLGQIGKQAPHLLRDRRRQRPYLAVIAAHFGAMAADGGGAQRREQPVYGNQGAATDKGQRAAQFVIQAQQRRLQIGGHHHGIGRAGEIEQSPVYVQKEGRIAVYERRHQGKSKSCVSIGVWHRAKAPVFPLTPYRTHKFRFISAGISVAR